MYELRYGTPKNYVVVASGSLISVIKSRTVSGELVFRKNGTLVKNNSWLFPWEKEDKNCYVQRTFQKGWIN